MNSIEYTNCCNNQKYNVYLQLEVICHADKLRWYASDIYHI